MKITFSDGETRILDAFYEIMRNPAYARSGRKRCRVLFYCYMFDCIHLDDLGFVFPEETGTPGCPASGTRKNSHRSFLNYLARSGWLSRLEGEYYTLTAAGQDLLFESLVSYTLLPSRLKGSFKRPPVSGPAQMSHKSKTGRMVLSFVQAGSGRFAVSPVFDRNAARIPADMAGARRAGCLIPDAFYMFSHCQERFYLEADSGEERMNSSLIPKFHRYLSTVFDPDCTERHCTLHFSLWGKDEKMADNHSSSETLKRMESLYDFIAENFDPSLSFRSYLMALSGYRGKDTYVLPMADFLSNIDLQNVSRKEDLCAAIFSRSFSLACSKQYLSRRKRLALSIEKTPFLKNILCQGARFVCTPLNHTKEFFPYIYLEQYDLKAKTEAGMQSLLPGLKIYSYESLRAFFSPATGETIFFRNVFCGDLSGSSIYLCMENISDDLSGNIRVINYLNNCNSLQLDNIYILCIYNHDSNPDLSGTMALYPAVYNRIFFISYSDFIRNIFHSLHSIT